MKIRYDLKDSTITQNINLIFKLNACVIEIIVCVKEKVINVTHKWWIGQAGNELSSHLLQTKRIQKYNKYFKLGIKTVYWNWWNNSESLAKTDHRAASI